LLENETGMHSCFVLLPIFPVAHGAAEDPIPEG